LQRRGDPPVAVAAILAGQDDDVSRPHIFIRAVHRQTALRSAPLLQHSINLPPAHSVPSARSFHRAPAPRLKVSLRYILQDLQPIAGTGARQIQFSLDFEFCETVRKNS
jgi:hypothetical protein